MSSDKSWDEIIKSVLEYGKPENKKFVGVDFAEDSRKVVIIAREVHQARHYARKKQIPKGKWFYIDRPEKLRGWTDVKIVMLADWNRDSYSRSDVDEISRLVDYLVSQKRAEVEHVQEW